MADGDFPIQNTVTSGAVITETCVAGSRVAVTNRTGTAEIVYTVDGTTPSAPAADGMHVVPAAISLVAPVAQMSGGEVKLISAGADQAYTITLV